MSSGDRVPLKPPDARARLKPLDDRVRLKPLDDRVRLKPDTTYAGYPRPLSLTLWYAAIFIAGSLVIVFITSLFTYGAYRIVLRARPHRQMNPEGDEYVDDESRGGDGR